MPAATAFETLNGFPREAISLANWRTRPYSFWSFRNVAEMVPSTRIKTSTPANLPPVVGNAGMLARPAWPGSGESVGEFLIRSETDSFVLSRDGVITGEWHAPGIDRGDSHLLFSISKSIAALVAGILEDRGLLDVSTPIAELVPESAHSGFADASVRDLLDMRVSLDFDESYLSEESYARYRRAMAWNPPTGDGAEEKGVLAFLCSLEKGPGEHGGDHTYLSPNTDMLGIVLERAAGRRFSDLCSELLWQPLGASADAVMTVDRRGAPRTAGGISCRPHDLLALGQMLMNGGRAGATQVISERWIADMQTAGDEQIWARGSQAEFLKQGRYRSSWYQVGGGSNAYLASGIHGQYLYCDPDSGCVISRTASQDLPQNDPLDQETLRVFAALCQG